MPETMHRADHPPSLRDGSVILQWKQHPCFWMTIVAGVLRLLWMWHVGPPHSDYGHEVGNIAASLANGHGFSSPFSGSTGPTAWVGPVYAALLGLIFRIFGIFSNQSAVVMLTLQCILSALTCIPMWCIGMRTVGRYTTFLAVATWAIVPTFMEWPATFIWDMTLTALFLTTLVSITLQLEEDDSTWRWCAWGMLWGVADLTNPALCTCNIICGAWLVWRRANSRQSWILKTTLAALLCVLVLAPWMMRNRVVFGEWVFIRSNGFFEMGLGNYENSNGFGYIGRSPGLNPRLFHQYQSMGETAFLEMKKQEFMDHVAQHPQEFLKLSAQRFWYFWDGTSALYSYGNGETRRSMYWPWSLLMAIGAIHFGYVNRSKAILFITVFLLYPLPYYFAYPHIRYRHAIEPMMLLFCGYVFTELLSSLQLRFKASSLEQ